MYTKSWAQSMLRAAAALLLMLTLFASSSSVQAAETKNTLLSANGPLKTVETADQFMNVLLAGVDFGSKGYYGSGNKKNFGDCHTDSIMIVSVNLTQKTIDLVSLPRDTITYVPGVRGIYKLNAAINCSDDVEGGIRNLLHSASWLLGGIPVDTYCVVDMNAMIVLGDAIGGVDFDLEMAYTGGSGRKYRKGPQHLDGQGMMDYVRARKNATIDYNDIGRTGRNRKMIATIIQKLKGDLTLLPRALSIVYSGKHHIYTNIRLSDIQSLMQTALTLDTDHMGSHVLTGRYRNALMGWNFTFTDQQNRLDVLKTVYGISAEPLPYVSYEYTNWLDKTGLSHAKYIFVAEKILRFAQAANVKTDAQQALLASFVSSYAETVSAYETAADTMNGPDDRALRESAKQLMALGDQVADAFFYKDAYTWKPAYEWFRDPDVNEYPDIKWY